MNRIFALLFLLLSPFLTLNSQEIGRLPFKNFSHRDYLGHFQNWAVIQDFRGMIYSCNNSGVLEYDGNDWRIISINNAIARCIDSDSNGRTWVGGQDEFGYLAPDSLGSMVYHSLNHLVDVGCLPFGMVRQVFATDNGIFFSANNCLFRVNGSKVDTWYPKTFFHRTYHVFDRIFSVQPEIGLTVQVNDTLILVPEGERFANTRVYAMVKYDEESILIATQSEGFFLYNISALMNGKVSTKVDILEPFQTSDDNFFKENWVYNGIVLPNGLFAFGTYRGGAVIIDSKGEIVQYIGKKQGIQDETVWNLTLDNQDNIWLALNNGISYSSIKSPITSWDETSGIQGVIQSVGWHNSILYVSTNAGVFYKENNVFKRVDEILNLSWDITPVTSSDGKVNALVGTGEGVFKLINGKAQLIDNGNVPTFKILQSINHPDIVFLGHYDGLGVAHYDNGKWKYLGRFKGVTDRVYSIVEDSQNGLWFTSWLKGIVHADISNPRSLVFDQSQIYANLPNNPNFDEDVRLAKVNGLIKVSTVKGLSYFDNNSNEFKPDSSLGTEFANGEKGIRIFLQDNSGTLWFESFKESHTRLIERAILGENDEFIRIPNEFNEIPRMIFYSVNVQDNKVTWIAGSDGLFRFDPLIKSRGIRIPQTLIRKVYTGNNQLVFGGAYAQPCTDGYYLCTGEQQDPEIIPQLSYKSNTLSFNFASPFFGQKGDMQFSCYLEGFDNDWTDWSSSNFKEYTNLPYGTYNFQVKSLSLYDVESAVTSFSFEIVRPWYFHPLMYVLYFFFFVIIIVSSVGLKTRMLKVSNTKLQNIVNERTNELLVKQRDILGKTQELIQQKEEIESQRDVLEYQSVQTRASLQYALTIQQVILPNKCILDEHFENFVIYLPKDVVSGDFYWFSDVPNKNGKDSRLFLAVVDCTGHGVPGAFMSMIGSRLLSEIIIERRIHDPAKILTELDKMIGSILRKDLSQNLDGMDVCLCTIDRITTGRYLVTFSGANMPIAYFKKGAAGITNLRGNRKSVGGIFPNIDTKFENHFIDLLSGDSLFLYTDGISDQNNEFDKRFTSSRLNSIFNSYIDSEMEEIGSKVLGVLEDFKGNTPQRDDITVMGIRLR